MMPKQRPHPQPPRPWWNTPFLLVLFCLVGLVSATTARDATRSHLMRQLRRLEDNDSGFDQWAGDLWDSAMGSIGFGDDNDADSGGDDLLDLLPWGNDDDGSGNDDAIEWGQPGAWTQWFSQFLEDIESENGGGSGLDGLFDGMGGLLEGTNGLFDGETPDACPLVEFAMGMGNDFGIQGNCTCNGDFESGLTINCNFDTCVPGASEVCGSVTLDVAFGGPDGTIDLSACASYENDQFPETCFSYEMDVTGDTTGEIFDQTCAATFGGQPCQCTIENGLCLTVDCSAYLPGARVDTCQALAMVDTGDVENWIPNFDVFQSDFQMLAEDVPWANLDLNNLDFDNFDWTAIRWGGNNESSLLSNVTSWTDLFGGNPTFFTAEGLSEGMCKLMAQAVDLSEELGNEGDCDCRYDETTGVLDLSCSFEDTCTGDNQNDLLIELPELCGYVSMNLTYASLAEIYTDVCVQFQDFPETCYSYGIPFAVEGGIPPLAGGPSNELPTDIGNNDSSSLTNGPPSENGAPVDIGIDLTKPDVPIMAARDCSARYGEPGYNNQCTCTIDANNCLTVDCTAFEPLAVTADCQVVDLDGATTASRMIPQFEKPGTGDVVSDGAGGAFVATASNGNTGSSGGASAAAAATTGTIAAMLTGLFSW